MADPTSPRSSKSVFDQIEDALGATANGRAFLRECGRRARTEETTLLLDAVARLERRVRTRSETIDNDELGSLVSQVETALRDARLALRRSIAPPHERLLPGEPPDVVTFGRETTLAISSFVEIIQETAWRMRESGFDPVLCDSLDEQTGAIHAACGRQDRMLDGLGTVERAIGRADAFVGELRRTITPTMPAPALPIVNSAPVQLIDSDIEFVVSPEKGPDGA